MRIGGWEAFDRWRATAPEELVDEAYKAIFAICDGSWRTVLDWYSDPINDTVTHVLVTPELVITWRVTPDYPSIVQVIYVGHPDLF